MGEVARGLDTEGVALELEAGEGVILGQRADKEKRAGDVASGWGAWRRALARAMAPWRVGIE